jgi:hypothetical protein
MGNALDAITGRDSSRAVYAALVEALDALGTYQVETKKTSLHVTRDRAFLGVHPRSTGLLLNIVTTSALDSPRVRKTERISANRCHNEVLLASADDVDDEVRAWIGQAYALAT